MRISLVIPFYNAMPFFGDLLSSICSNMTEISDQGCFEFVFINDGSTDDYSGILDEFTKKFPSVKLISQENMGVAYARNQGIKAATGDYIWFVDSDDIVEDHAFLNVIEALKATELPDLVFFDCKGYDDQNNGYHYFDYNYSAYMSGIEYVENDEDRSRIYDVLFGKLKINYAIWYQFFKREMLIQNNITFDTELKTSEDLDFKFAALSHARSVMGLDICIYIYRFPNTNRNSLSKGKISNEQLILLCNMYSRRYEKFNSEVTAVLSAEANGYSLMKNKFSLLVYSSYKLLLQNKDNEMIQEYLRRNEPYLREVYTSNQEYLEWIIAEMKKGNYAVL